MENNFFQTKAALSIPISAAISIHRGLLYLGGLQSGRTARRALSLIKGDTATPEHRGAHSAEPGYTPSAGSAGS